MGNWESGDAIDLRIPNWDKWQAEGKRYGSTTWFRLDNGLPMHELWEELSGDEFKAMIGVFCYLSQKCHKTGRAERVRFSTLERLTGYPRAILVSTLVKLSNLGVTDVAPCEPRAETVPAPCEPRDQTPLRNGTERNRTERDDEGPAPDALPGAADLVALGLDGTGDFLRDSPDDRIEHAPLAALVTAYGLATVHEAALRAGAKWAASPQRRSDYAIRMQGGRLEYLRNWLENDRKERAGGRAAKRGADVPSVDEFARKGAAG